ncbi:MAG: hypothetical protein M3319_02920, partial [Actinomycetota bacterium]|nr:hypothetical protein [Actinomycetota bacterium]
DLRRDQSIITDIAVEGMRFPCPESQWQSVVEIDCRKVAALGVLSLAANRMEEGVGGGGEDPAGQDRVAA